MLEPKNRSKLAALGNIGDFVWLLVVGVFSFYGGTRSFDQDEAFSVWIARGGWDNILRYIADDPHAPLFYSLLSLWINLGGESEAWVRLLPGLIYLAGFGLIWFLGRRAFSARQLRWLLVALVISKLYRAQALNARMYGLLEVESCIATIAYVGLVGGRMSRRLGFGSLLLANLAGMFTHYFYFLLVGAIGLHSLMFRRDLFLRVLGCAVAPALVFAIFWGPVFLKQLAGSRFETAVGGRNVFTVRNAVSEALLLLEIHFGRLGLFVALPCLLVLLVLRRRGGRYRFVGIQALRVRWQSQPEREIFGVAAMICALCFMIPIMLAFKIGEFKQPPTAILTLFPLCLMIMLIFERAGDSVSRTGLAIVLLLMSLVLESRGRYLFDHEPRSDRAWLTRIFEGSDPGDAIIASSGTFFPLVDYYARHNKTGRDMSVFVFPEQLATHPGWYQEKLRILQSSVLIEEAQVLATKLAANLASGKGKRVWLITLAKLAPKTSGAISDALESRLREVERIDVTGNAALFDLIVGYELREPRLDEGAKNALPGAHSSEH